jgi:hypothetical protein
MNPLRFTCVMRELAPGGQFGVSIGAGESSRIIILRAFDTHLPLC